MKKNFLFLIIIGAMLILNVSSKAQIVFYSGFENWTGSLPDDWGGSRTTFDPDSVVEYTQNVHSGNKACRLINRISTNKYFSTKGFIVEAGATYVVSFWARGNALIFNPFIYCGTDISLPGISQPFNNTNWEFYTSIFTAPVSTISAELVFTIRRTNPNLDDVQIDDVLIYKSDPSDVLDINNISAMINSNGSLFNSNGISHFEVPKGSGNHTIFESNLWMGGLNSNSNLHLAAQTYGHYIPDFSFGPIANN
ncbi:MAG: hypothetical protein H0X62_04315 [Bacteroidetes bacterium]|nr:hypothetical protein [Bacteroidota bacterium]